MVVAAGVFQLLRPFRGRISFHALSNNSALLIVHRFPNRVLSHLPKISFFANPNFRSLSSSASDKITATLFPGNGIGLGIANSAKQVSISTMFDHAASVSSTSSIIEFLTLCHRLKEVGSDFMAELMVG